MGNCHAGVLFLYVIPYRMQDLRILPKKIYQPRYLSERLRVGYDALLLPYLGTLQHPPRRASRVTLKPCCVSRVTDLAIFAPLSGQFDASVALVHKVAFRSKALEHTRYGGGCDSEILCDFDRARMTLILN